MTTLSEAREAIYQRFVDQWVTTTDFGFDNEEFEEPADEPWARLTVRSLSRAQDTLGRIGNRRFRSNALVFVQVFTRSNVGMKQGDDLATQAANIFEGVSFSGLDFREAAVSEIPDSGKWNQHVVEAPFDYDEIK